jgi:hypothetical protein
VDEEGPEHELKAAGETTRRRRSKTTRRRRSKTTRRRRRSNPSPSPGESNPSCLHHVARCSRNEECCSHHCSAGARGICVPIGPNKPGYPQRPPW